MKVEAAEVEVDRGAETVAVPEATSAALEPLDRLLALGGSQRDELARLQRSSLLGRFSASFPPPG